MEKEEKIRRFIDYLKKNGKTSVTKLQRETIRPDISGEQRKSNFKNILLKDLNFNIIVEGKHKFVILNNDKYLLTYFTNWINCSNEEFKMFINKIKEKEKIGYEDFIECCPDVNLMDYDKILNKFLSPADVFELEASFGLKQGCLCIENKHLMLRK